jgi:hypothetical protein
VSSGGHAALYDVYEARPVTLVRLLRRESGIEAAVWALEDFDERVGAPLFVDALPPSSGVSSSSEADITPERWVTRPHPHPRRGASVPDRALSMDRPRSAMYKFWYRCRHQRQPRRRALAGRADVGARVLLSGSARR